MADATVVKDSVYSFEVARRAVGRAALHLGIDSMTEQALDVMADVLLQYLTRTGQAMSHLAESSRRTSAHVNVLDAFQACQLVTSPAVARLHLQEPEEEEDIIEKASEGATSDGISSNGITGSSNGGHHSISRSSSTSINGGGVTQPNGISSTASQSSTGWKGLAAFAFGPKWLEETNEEDYLMEKSIAAANAAADTANDEGSSGGAAAGKVFRSSIENGDAGDQHGGAGDISTLGAGRRRKRRGWDAPYPDGVPLFPRASATCANPHALPAKLSGGLSYRKGTCAYRKVDVDPEEAAEKEREALDELETLPDDVFVPAQEETSSDMAAVNGSSWGSLEGNHKRKLEQANNNGQQEATGSNYTKDQDGDVDMESANKKVRFGDGSADADHQNGGASKKKEIGASSIISEQKGGKNGEDSNTMPEEFMYIPSFYPRPPSTKVVVDDRRTVVDTADAEEQRLLQQVRTQHQEEQQISDPASAFDPTGAIRDTMNIDSSQGVRTSLVRLGNSYWGSGWDRASSSASTMAVPMGRNVSGPDSAPGVTGPPKDPIEPMSRASGSRVSRVLEGSMDAAAMQ
uniref:Transcription initiation factor TFIID subunit 8 n=1 Tax=Pseudo-nitzschia australis TaxID=44445 RepID=A0A7S4AG21_9STRA|mmetsp:Transcript_2275/g.4887  ORF Transcript_2275/g.4887 Transcript_2275/m.4887 type:complete len:575 (+) Transcript_2275:382-2106(+)|eukprot:CAMPEP_0168166066 /NCGR_PEP_ID=MMETSP0139_2-20121125/1822_1 /TAXON_ID=44445 /ORGANISM="Pseudo-nitzschia australis, Strain 10249 10 AB" /LENGTH=574 /DNA_ID=CAMNT_0008083225 /DNA_START=370 /DNA_END=2094 /DNA_ORIENTATION=+